VHSGETFAVPSEAPKLNLFLKIWRRAPRALKAVRFILAATTSDALSVGTLCGSGRRQEYGSKGGTHFFCVFAGANIFPNLVRDILAQCVGA
jgi:hypothetical protein